jgi:hypothetical protein
MRLTKVLHFPEKDGTLICWFEHLFSVDFFFSQNQNQNQNEITDFARVAVFGVRQCAVCR